MSRPRLADAALLLGLALAAGCHSRPPAQQKAAVAPPAPAPPPAPVVSAISRPSGALIVLAEVDHQRLTVVADEQDSALHVVDVATRTLVLTKRLDGNPGQLLLAPDGTLFVAIRGAARVATFRFAAGHELVETASHATADEPFGLALTPDGATLLVTTIAEPRLEALRARDLAPVFGIVLPRDPRSIAVTPDGARAFVSHATGSKATVVDLGPAAPGASRTVALDALERRRDFGVTMMSKPTPPRVTKTNGSPHFEPPPRITLDRTATQGFGLAMIGERVFLPETLVMTSDNKEIPSGYGSITQTPLGSHIPFVAQVTTSDEKLANASFSGPEDQHCFIRRRTQCILPRAVVDDGKQLYVACLDTNEVVVVDPALDADHAPACEKTSTARLPVDNPTGLAVDPAREEVIAFSSFTRKLTALSLRTEEPTAEILLPAPLAVQTELVAEGRELFHRSGDSTIARNGRACASCHVDGRDDGLVWPTPLGQRQTPMLAGRIEGTAPYGWNGEHATLAQHITTTVKNLEGRGLQPQALDALAAYVGSMKATEKRPHPSTLAQRGQGIFRSAEAGCSSCHAEDTRFTDHETHTLAQVKGSKAHFDTPSLAFVGQTAPYFHDGRFTSLEQLVESCEDPATNMGRTKHLAPDDKQALVAYLRTL